MKTVVVQYGDVVRFYENVTRVQFFRKEDLFESYFVIFQEKGKTIIMANEINGLEIRET